MEQNLIERIKILAEAIGIIAEHLLYADDKLCGSIEGRRLQYLVYELRRHRSPGGHDSQ